MGWFPPTPLEGPVSYQLSKLGKYFIKFSDSSANLDDTLWNLARNCSLLKHSTVIDWILQGKPTIVTDNYTENMAWIKDEGVN